MARWYQVSGDARSTRTNVQSYDGYGGAVYDQAGTMTIVNGTFSGNSAGFAYTVNGITRAKVITRHLFVAPGTGCQ
jgi:hypothetical protein